MGLTLSGLASGWDWESMVDQLIEVERSPQKRLRTEQTTLQERNNALSSVKTQLNGLLNRVATLKDASLFDSRTASTSDGSLATASAAAGTPLGTTRFQVTQLASASSYLGAADIGASLSETDDVSGLILSTAHFASSVTAGTFTVNGKRITIETSETLQSVFDKINAATGLTASYSAAADTITLQGASEIVLGSATDTSNFLQVARLANNGSATISSSGRLGAIAGTVPLSTAAFATAITDGGAGAGEFRINGVSIAFNASSDNLNAILTRINDSAAGVLASYDAANDRIALTNKVTGDIGIALEDVTGNFLAATGLSQGTLRRGANLLYTLNGGPQLTSQSNTITEASSGITGLRVEVLAEGAFSVTVGSDTAKIKSAITGLVEAYNSTQALINSQTASSTDANGKVTAGLLADDTQANSINARLRQLLTTDVEGLSGLVRRLDDLGFNSNGNDDSLSTTDTSNLDELLAHDLVGLRDLFTHESTGLASRLNSYLDSLLDDEGPLATHQSDLTRQSADIDTQIADMERLVQTNRQRLIESFTAMEEAQSRMNQQLTYLQKYFS